MAELPAGTHFHDLRHNYGSMLIGGGVSVVVVARQVGHKDATETVRTYSQLFKDSAAKTRRVVDEALARPPRRRRVGTSRRHSECRVSSVERRSAVSNG